LEYSFLPWKAKAIYVRSITAMTRKIRSKKDEKVATHGIGLVGAGRMGALHARNAAASQRFELKSIADHQEEAAARLASDLDATLASYEDMLADPDIDGVIVASSTASHLENVLAAVRAGKAVFCEKPLSLDADTLAAALPDIEACGRPVFVAFNRRFDPHFAGLKQSYAAGAIGRAETLHIINHDPATPRLDFIPRSGGLFKDFTIHDFDTAAWLLDDGFTEVFAVGACLIDPAIGELGDLDTAKLVLRGSGGALCLISNSRRTGYGYDQRIELFGSKGMLRVDNIEPIRVDLLSEAGTSRTAFPYSFVERYADAYLSELDHFGDVLDGRASPGTGPRDSLRALRLADAAEQSVRTRAPVRLQIGEAGHAH
jgi:myo-inositol 2-dehydrogenase/D-chiro-inositol 1-dehydrogenase